MVDPRWPRALLVALAIAIGLTLAVTGATSTAAFGAYNPAWDGTADLRALPGETGTDSELLQNTSAYADVPPNGSLAVVLSPRDAYANPIPVRQFVRDGGTLLVAEDFRRHANPLLAAVGADARIDGRPVRDERSYGQTPAFPIAPNVSDHALTDGVEELALNHPSAVVPNAATVLVRTSSESYLDIDRNAQLDDADPLDSYPVATVESVGDGTVIVIADPSLFINAMLDRRSNRAFASALIDGHERVLFDVSHAGALPLLVAIRLALQESVLLQLLLGSAVVLGILTWRRLATLGPRLVDTLRRDTPPDPPHPDRDAVAQTIASRHPDWDTARIDRLTEAVMRSEAERGTDDGPQ